MQLQLELVSDVLGMLQARIDETGTEIRIPRPLPKLICDPLQVQQLFLNLLSNALKYTTENGRVQVQIEQSPDGYVQFAVSDDGRGIPRQFVSRVFDKFFRVPGQAGDSGTGLGLAIVKDIVEAHGGRIWVESREGRGTTFRFVLPRASHVQQEVGHDSTTTQFV